MIRPTLLLLLATWLSAASQAAAGSVSGSCAPIPQGTDVDLTRSGTEDWVHWGLFTEATVNRKLGVPVMISNYSMVKPSPIAIIVAYQFSDNYNGYTWYDGSPVLTQTNTTTGVWAYQSWPPISQSPLASGYGFQFTVPADTTPRTLKIYVGAFQARGQLKAILSDGGLPYTDTSLSNVSNGPGAVYSISFHANSPNQVLTIQWTLFQQNGTNGGGNVTLQAATLSAADANNPPLVFLDSPADSSNFTTPGPIPFTATAYDLDGTVTNVSFFHDATPLASAAAPPYSATWDNVLPGKYVVYAQAQDNLGAVRSSTPNVVYVYSQGGSLSGSVAPPPSTVDLTSEGVADWVHMGSITNDTLVRKSGVVPQIQVSPVGTNTLTRFTDAPSYYSWSDGTPILSDTGTSSGVYLLGEASGFRITAPADPTTRKLKIYLGCYGTSTRLEAYLSDFTAPAYLDTSLQSDYKSDYAVYQINYSSAAAGQSLIVNFQSSTLFDSVWGNVNFSAATLQGGPALLKIAQAWFSSGTFNLSFNTDQGRLYRIDYADGSPAGWTELTQVTGTGSIVTVTDPTPAPTGRFYRVVAP